MHQPGAYNERNSSEDAECESGNAADLGTEPQSKPRLQPKAAPRGYQGEEPRAPRRVQPPPPPRRPVQQLSSDAVSTGATGAAAAEGLGSDARTGGEGDTPPTPPLAPPKSPQISPWPAASFSPPASSSTLPWRPGYMTDGSGQPDAKMTMGESQRMLGQQEAQRPTAPVASAAAICTTRSMPLRSALEMQAEVWAQRGAPPGVEAPRPPAPMPAARPARSELLRGVQERQAAVQAQLGIQPNSNGILSVANRNGVTGIWGTYWTNLYERAEQDGMTRGARAEGMNDVSYPDYWYCPFCQKDVREQDLDAHLGKKKHLDNKAWAQSLPAPCPVLAAAPHAAAPSQAAVAQSAPWSVVPYSPVAAPAAPSPPAHWGDPRLFEYDPASWRFKCKLCSKFADDAHVSSENHKKWVQYASDFVPEIRAEEDAARARLTNAQLPQPPQATPTTDLPDGWREAWDPERRQMYYYTTDCQVTQWDRPRAPQQLALPSTSFPSQPPAPWHVQPAQASQASHVAQPMHPVPAQPSQQSQFPQPMPPVPAQSGAPAALPRDTEATECSWARGWWQRLDPSTGRLYYFIRYQGKADPTSTQWEPPPADRNDGMQQAPPQLPPQQTQLPSQRPTVWPSQQQLPLPHQQAAFPVASTQSVQPGAWSPPALPSSANSAPTPTLGSSGPQPPPPPPRPTASVSPPPSSYPQATQVAPAVPPPPPPTGRAQTGLDARMEILEF